MKYSIVCKGVSRLFGSQRALDRVDLALPSKGMVGFLGCSGSGKTTLLNILSMLDVGYGGEVRILGCNPKKLSERKRGAFRLKNIGYVFQSFELSELETALRNVYLSIDSTVASKRSLKRKKAADLLRFVEMEGFSDQEMQKLSGGQPKRNVGCLKAAKKAEDSIIFGVCTCIRSRCKTSMFL